MRYNKISVNTEQQLHHCNISDRRCEDEMPRVEICLWSTRSQPRGRGTVVRALTDSGCTAALLDYEAMKKVKIHNTEILRKEVKVKNASGDLMTTLGEVDIWLKLNDGRQKYKRMIRAVVVKGLGEDFVLGIKQLKTVSLLSPNWPAPERGEDGVDTHRCWKLEEEERATLSLEE